MALGAVSKQLDCEREGESALPLPPRMLELDEQSRLANHDAAYLAGQSPSLPQNMGLQHHSPEIVYAVAEVKTVYTSSCLTVYSHRLARLFVCTDTCNFC